MSISKYTQATHKLLTNLKPDMLILFNNVIDKLSHYMEVEVTRIDDRDDYNMLLDNCCELIKETDYTLYKYFSEVFSYILNSNKNYKKFDFEYDLQSYIFKKNEPNTIEYAIDYCYIDIDIFLDEPATYVNMLRYTLKKYGNKYVDLQNKYFNKLMFYKLINTYITEGCYIYGNIPSKDIIFIVCNIGGIINIFNFYINFDKYMNLSESCRDNYKRIIENNSLLGHARSSYKYNKFSDVYNLYRKVFI